MIDMRYHVISLVAVFLALGIGILLGTTLVERGLIAEQKSEIEYLQETFSQIKETNSTLHAQIEDYSDFVSQSRPYILDNRLGWGSYVIIKRGSPTPGIAEKIIDPITSAGGMVPYTVTLAGVEVYEIPNVRDSLSRLFGVPPDPAVLRTEVFSEIAFQISTLSNPAIMDELQALGVIEMSGPLSHRASGALLLPNSGEEGEVGLQDIDVTLIRSFSSVGVPLTGLGDAGTAEAVMRSYKDNGISTVDNVDTDIGQIAMVLVLEGRSGNYGIGVTAESVLPPLTGE